MAKLPYVSSNIDRDLRQHLDRTREAFGSQEKEINTLRSLVTALTASVKAQEGTLSAVAASVATSFPPGWTVVEAPTAPTALRAFGALANIIISWDAPTYSGHAYTEVWAAQAREDGGVPALGDASLIGMTPGNVYAHNIGGSATRWYWVRFVNEANQAGPYNAVSGFEASTSPDPAFLLSLLNGQITESELFGALGARIDLIDGDDTVPGSVNARVAAEAATRSDETGNLFGQYTVKVDLDGYVTGYGLASSVVDGVPSSSFIVRSDTFAIGSTLGAPVAPFIVRTSATTINGQAVPAGTYIADAFIANGVITSAKIGLAVIDESHIVDASIVTAKIGNAQITTAKIKDLDVTTAKIANLNVTTGKIADLAVDTLQIAGNAVTVPDYAESALFSRVSGAAGWSSNVFGSVNRPTVFLNVASPVLIVWTIEQGYIAGDSPRWAWRVKKNGLIIDSREFPMWGFENQPSGSFLSNCTAGTSYFDFDWYGDAQIGEITAVIRMWVMAAQK